MPLVAQALACYVAGLVVGGTADPFAAVVVCLIAAGTALSASRRDLCALAVLTCAGVLVQRGAVAADDRCLRAALHRPRLGARLLGTAVPGAMVRAEALECHAEIGVFVVEGQGAPGSIVAIDGAAARGKSGWVMQHALVTLLHEPRGLDRIRDRAGESIDRAFRDDAPLARALLIADKQELAPEVRDQFAVAGLAHILAIAGLHIAVVGALIEMLLGLCGMDRASRSAWMFGAIVGYVVMIGAPPSAVRAAAMLGARSVSRLTQRPTSPWALLAIGASEPLLDPRVALSIGYQLSVVCVAGLIVAAGVAARLRRRRSPLVNHLVGGIIGTSLATAASAPLVAGMFGRVSLIAPLSNLLIEPLFALMQPMLFLAMCLAFAPALAAFVADAAHPLLHAMTVCAGILASIPGASVAVRPDAMETVLGLAAVGALLAACGSRVHGIRWATCACGCLAGLAWLPVVPLARQSAELRVVRQGRRDVVTLLGPDGRSVALNESDRRRLPSAGVVVDGVIIRAVTGGAGPSEQATSSAVLVELGQVRMLIAGALTGTEQLALAGSATLPQSDVILMTRGQRATETSPVLLDRLAPALVILAGNGASDPSLLHAVNVFRAELVRTDQAGTVSVRTDGNHLWLRVGIEDWVLLPKPD